MPDEFCPRCGEPRIGIFRFCKGCRFDFDEGQVVPEPPESQPPPGWRAPTKARPIGRYIAIGIAALVGLGAVGNLTGANTVSSSASASAPASAVALSTTAPRTTAVASMPAVTAFGPSGPTVDARVVRVVDGDTIVVDIGGTQYHLRYIGMDTPESVQPNTPVEPMALAATAANKVLVEGKTVILEKDVSEIDQYGRILRDVWVQHDGAVVLVGLELVRDGFAQVTTYPPDVKYVDLLTVAQDSARTAAIGLWGSAAAATLAPTGTPAPTASPRPPVPLVGGTTKCHPSYSPCLPIVDDLDCPDVKAMGKAPVTIKGPDDYRLDRDGDGLGCE